MGIEDVRYINGEKVIDEDGDSILNIKKIKDKTDIEALLNTIDCDPFQILAVLAMTAEKETVKCNAAAELCSYIAPKLRSVEVTGDNKNPFIINLNLAGGLIHDALALPIPMTAIENIEG